MPLGITLLLDSLKIPALQLLLALYRNFAIQEAVLNELGSFRSPDRQFPCSLVAGPTPCLCCQGAFCDPKREHPNDL